MLGAEWPLKPPALTKYLVSIANSYIRLPFNSVLYHHFLNRPEEKFTATHKRIRFSKRVVQYIFYKH